MRSPPAGEVLGIERIRAALGCALHWDTRCAGPKGMRWASPPTSLWNPIPPGTTGRYEFLTAAKLRLRRSRATASQLCFGARGAGSRCEDLMRLFSKMSLPLWGRWPEGTDEVSARRWTARMNSGFKQPRSEHGESEGRSPSGRVWGGSPMKGLYEEKVSDDRAVAGGACVLPAAGG